MRKVFHLFLLPFVFLGCESLSQTVQTSTSRVDTTPTTNISQLTKDQVLNGYNQCGQQFTNGIYSFPGTYEEWSNWDIPRRYEEKISCPPYIEIYGDQLEFADLDGDGINEALAPARVVSASSGGVIFLFKKVDGAARVIDQIVLGKPNGKIISINKNIIVVETDGFPFYQGTYKFVNNSLFKQ